MIKGTKLDKIKFKINCYADSVVLTVITTGYNDAYQRIWIILWLEINRYGYLNVVKYFVESVCILDSVS